MNNENKNNPPRKHNGPPGMMAPEKAKDFKKSIKRLFIEVGSFKRIIIIAIVLSIVSAILSIISPNKLKDFTNEIANGLMINKENMSLLTEKINNNINNNRYEDIVIDRITISFNDQMSLINLMKNNDTKDYSKLLNEIPSSVKEVIKPSMNKNKINDIVILLIVIYVLSALFNYIQAICMAIVSNKFAKKLRSSISKKMNKLPLKYFDKNMVGDILSRITNDVDTISQGLNQSLSSLISNIVLFVGTIIMMFLTNYILAITAIVASILGFISMGFILSKSQKYFKERQEELGKLNSHIEEAYSGLKIVKLYNAKKESKKEFDRLNNRVREANFKSQFLSGIMMPLMAFVGNFGYVAVCIVGAMLAVDGKISFGVIVAFMTYVRLFINPLTQLGQSFNSLQSSAAASERVFEFLDEEEIVEEKTEDIDFRRIKGNIEFKNVEFTYDGNDSPTIKNFSATSKKGQKIAIVGPTGAGKTTMVNLLMRFYDINKGSIEIDGINIKEIKRENIHRLFTMVLQDTWLFEGTIKENVIYNRENISDEEVVSACKKVGLDYFIRALPDGYDSLLSESETLSIGQKQLLTIARAMLSKTPFLILDEATSNVDTRTEILVQNAMDKLIKDKTSFIIAHRLSTIKNADLILVMKDGNIVEQGNHNELLKKKGFYYELYNSQFEE